MRRVPAPFVVAVMLLGVLAFGRPARGTIAQDDAAATAAHPAVGSWLLSDPAFPDDPPTLVVFHGDGTFLQEDPEDLGVGTWEATGERSLALTFVLLVGDGAGGTFTVTIRAAGEVDASGDAFSATYTIGLTMPDGTSTGEYGPGSVTATRMAVEPMGTPVGPIEAFFAQFPEEATPAP